MPVLDTPSNLTEQVLNAKSFALPSITTQSCEQLSCKHCQQPLNSTQERISGFCCLGCRAAHNMIATLGLTHFYELRERDPKSLTKPVIDVNSRFNHFDDERFADSYIVKEAKSRSRMIFQIPGIHCAACVWLLEKLPDVISGVLQVRVDLLRGTAVVRFDPQAIRPSELGYAFAELGYVPHPIAKDGTHESKLPDDRLFAAQLGVAAFAAMNVMLLFFARHQGYLTSIESSYATFIAWVCLFLSIPVVTFSALPFYKTSLNSLKHHRLHIDLPIAIAIVGGFIASALNTVLGREEIYFDTVTALVFLLLLGRWTQRYAMKRIASSTNLLNSLTPLCALRVNKEGKRDEVYIESISAGETVVIEPGESFPCDGVVVLGQSHVNNAILSGESKLVPIQIGSEVFAGTKNFGAEVEVTVSTIGSATRIGRLVDEIRCSPFYGSRISRFVDRVSIVFVVGVLTLALITFFIWIDAGPWIAWDHVIALLVVSCPCALGIATPVTLSLAGMRAARHGLLLKNGEALERLAQINEVVFDKTGTLTRGELGVSASELINPTLGWDKVWGIVRALEHNVEHPIAKALERCAERCESSSAPLRCRSEVSGCGVRGTLQSGQTLQLGSITWLRSAGNNFSANAERLINEFKGTLCTIIGLTIESELVAVFALSDQLRPEASTVISSLSRRNIKRTILSGDSKDVVNEVGGQLDIKSENRFAEFSPEQKAEFIRERGEHTAFVGDGVNDGLALSCAGVGIGISGGAEICMAVSDIFLMRPDLALIVEAIDGAKATVRQIHRHLVISLAYNVVAASLAVTGHIGPLAAALVMPLSSLSVLASSFWRAPFGGEK